MMKWRDFDDYMDQMGWGSARENVKREWFEHEGERLAVDMFLAGEDSPVILFHHGIAVYPRLYWPFLNRMRELGYSSVAPTRKGHGHSSGRRGDCTIEESVEVARAALAWIKERFSGPYLMMGSSLGGYITVAALSAGVEVDAAACHNAIHPELAPLFYQRTLLAMARPLLRLLPDNRCIDIRHVISFRGVTDDRDLYKLVDTDDLIAWRYTLRALRSIVTFKPPRPYSAIKTPTMFVVGERDPMIPPGYMKKVFGKLTCKKRFEVLPGAGHMLPLEYLDPFVQTVDKWFNECLC